MYMTKAKSRQKTWKKKLENIYKIPNKSAYLIQNFRLLDNFNT